MFDRQVLPAHSVGLRLAWYVSAALSVTNVAATIGDSPLRKTVFVADKLVNFVV